MRVDEYIKAMEICEKKFAESNWTPPKEFTPYRKLYRALTSGEKIDGKPKFEKVLQGAIDDTDISKQNWLSITVLELNNHAWELDGTTITYQLTVEVPAIKFEEHRWAAANYIIVFSMNTTDKLPIDVFLQTLFIIPESIGMIRNICRMRGIHLDEAELAYLQTVEKVAVDKDEGTITIDWKVDEDWDMEEIQAELIKKRETWTKIYQEMKYGLGL